jgi:hypothetical protein
MPTAYRKFSRMTADNHDDAGVAITPKIMTTTILFSRVNFHRLRAERFRSNALKSSNPDFRGMYTSLAVSETALAQRLEGQRRRRQSES